MRGTALGRLASIAEFQWGLVTARQAMGEGVARWDLSRLTADAALECVGYGVYRLAGAPRVNHLELRVAWLQLEPGTVAEDRDISMGVISHTSAAIVWGAGDFESDTHEFTCPHRKRSRRSDVTIHTALLGGEEVGWIDQLPVARPARTVADLLADRHDGEHVGRVLVDLMDAGLATPPDLATAASAYAVTYGFPDGSGEQLVDHLSNIVTQHGR